jgi:hypothetical protein
LDWLSASAGLRYGLLGILTFLAKIVFPPFWNTRYFHFLGVIIQPYSWIAAYFRLVHTVPTKPSTFSTIDHLNAPVLYGAFSAALLLTSVTDCRRALFSACGFVFRSGTCMSALIIFLSYLDF